MMAVIAAEIDDEYDGFTDDEDDREESSDSFDSGSFLDPGSDLRAGRQALGLTRNYVPDWTTRDAFREFVQNWKDDIIEKNDLDPEQFLLDIENTKDSYIARVQAPDLNGGSYHVKKESKGLLGFIRYSKKDGSLQLTNFKSYLTRAALGLGFTTKRKKVNLAGTHGEGFKVASLVMVNKGYQVRIEASRFYWKFKYFPNNPYNLYCVLSAASEKKIEKDKEKQRKDRAKALPRGLTANIWEDVTVKIGKVYRPWSESASIKLEDFQSWLMVSLDLERPSDVIKTSHGSLILDPCFQGRLYLRELLLELNNPLATLERKFRFAYNLVQGRVNRDRQSLSSSAEEAQEFALIWKEAIEKSSENLLKNYIELLKEDDRWADVSRAKDFIDEATAKVIWQSLLKDDPERRRFYYDQRGGEHDVELIRKSLKREPVQLSRSIWEPMRRWGLVRTPQEQQCHLLRNAPVANPTETLYSLGVRRALSAALAVDKRTRELSLTFRSGYTAGLDVLIDESHLLIHERCLDFFGSHETNACRLVRLASHRKITIETFSCDHIVMDLYELVLNELIKEHEKISNEAMPSHSSLYLQVSESMREMPRKIEIAQGPKAGEIEVSWVDFASDMASRLHGLNLKGRVILHRERTCPHKRFELMVPKGDYEQETQVPEAESPIKNRQSIAECGCPEQIVSQKDSKTTFYDLDVSEEYFPMIARMYAQAFFGLPPPGLRPKGREEKIFSTPGSKVSARSHVREPAHVNDYEGSDDLYGVSDCDGDYMQVDLPYRSSSYHSPNKTTEPVQQPARGSATNTPISSGGNTIQIPQKANCPTPVDNNPEITQLQDEIKALRKQLDDVKRQFKASDEALEESNVKLESLQTAFDLKGQVLETKSKECNSLQQNLTTANQQVQKARQMYLTLLAETQRLRKDQEPLSERLRDANTECSSLRTENQTLRETNDTQLKQLQSIRDELLATRVKFEDNQKIIERMLERNMKDDQMSGQGPGSQASHTEWEDEIDRLKQKVQQLRETRDRLKIQLTEAQKDAQESHATTREMLRHMISMRESESQSQPPVTPRRSVFGEASGSGSWCRVKRESVDEGESSGTPTRGSKRIKQEEVIDLTD